jgi:hypothetical protein
MNSKRYPTMQTLQLETGSFKRMEQKQNISTSSTTFIGKIDPEHLDIRIPPRIFAPRPFPSTISRNIPPLSSYQPRSDRLHGREPITAQDNPVRVDRPRKPEQFLKVGTFSSRPRHLSRSQDMTPTHLPSNRSLNARFQTFLQPRPLLPNLCPHCRPSRGGCIRRGYERCTTAYIQPHRFSISDIYFKTPIGVFHKKRLMSARWTIHTNGAAGTARKITGAVRPFCKLACATNSSLNQPIQVHTRESGDPRGQCSFQMEDLP